VGVGGKRKGATWGAIDGRDCEAECQGGFGRERKEGADREIGKYNKGCFERTGSWTSRAIY